MWAENNRKYYRNRLMTICTFPIDNHMCRLCPFSLLLGGKYIYAHVTAPFGVCPRLVPHDFDMVEASHACFCIHYLWLPWRTPKVSTSKSTCLHSRKKFVKSIFICFRFLILWILSLKQQLASSARFYQDSVDIQELCNIHAPFSAS